MEKRNFAFVTLNNIYIYEQWKTINLFRLILTYITFKIKPNGKEFYNV